MSASDALSRQFTPAEVEAHVPGAFAMGDVHPTDRFEKRLIPFESVEHGGGSILDIDPEDVHEDGHSRRKVLSYIDDMKKPGGAAKFPPVVVAKNNDGSHEFLDGHHRMHAATAVGIRHGAAYVRVNRPAW